MQRRFRGSKKYLRAVGELYGGQIELGAVEGIGVSRKLCGEKKKAVKLDVPKECEEQFKISAWLRKMNIVHHHSPNGGQRNYLEGAKFKRMGVSAGFPDLILPYARKGYHSLFVELKRIKNGKLSEVQLEWISFLNNEGHKAVVCCGAEEAIKVIEDYFNESTTIK